jgi:hypothetical protein
MANKCNTQRMHTVARRIIVITSFYIHTLIKRTLLQSSIMLQRTSLRACI